MALKLSHLYAAPEVNPINHKARAIPLLNLVNVYGRVFFFSWFGFMVAFWAWYTFPPLVRQTIKTLLAVQQFYCSCLAVLMMHLGLQLTATIKQDLHLSPSQVANSNIISLCVT